jgi:hypothetical protein
VDIIRQVGLESLRFGGCSLLRLVDSIFITSVAAMTAGNTPCLSELCSPQFHRCIQASGRVDKTLLQQSPSLMMLQEVLEERLAEASVYRKCIN